MCMYLFYVVMSSIKYMIWFKKYLFYKKKLIVNVLLWVKIRKYEDEKRLKCKEIFLGFFLFLFFMENGLFFIFWFSKKIFIFNGYIILVCKKIYVL